MTVSWRDKYLQALTEQENSEKRSAKQLQQLRNCLNALAAAAIGLDPEFDQVLEPLADPKGKAASRQVKSDQITLAANKVCERKATRETISLESLQALVLALLNLNPDGELTRKLKAYQRLLPQRVKNYHAYPQLLQEIARLHDQVISHVVTKKPGRMARLFGASPTLDLGDATLAVESGVGDTADDPDPVADPESHAGPVPKSDTLEDADQGEFLPFTERASEDTSVELEPGYASIQSKIQFILQELIATGQGDEAAQAQLLNAKRKLEEGLNWYEMIATLERIRDLFSGVLMSKSAEFTEYLQEVDAALLQIKQTWLGLIDSQQVQVTHQKEVKQQLQSQEAQLLIEVDKAPDIAALKASVSRHVQSLGACIHAIDGMESQTIESSQTMIALQAQIDLIEAKNRALEEQLAKQTYVATHDELTGLPNRAAYNQRLAEEMARWQRYKRPLVMAVLDVDHFKRFNDTYGHQAGDRVLKIIAKTLQENVREVDFVARFGGEEFVMLLPETTAENAATLLDKLRRILAEAKYKFKDEPVTITASFGMTELGEEDTSDIAFERADQALYQAKQNGRNQVAML